MKTKHVFAAMVILACCQGIAAPGAVQRPEWASGVPLYGVLRAQGKLPGDVPKLAEGNLRFVAQDDAGRIYILRAGVREVGVYRPDGRALDGFTLPAPLDPLHVVDAFAVNGSGDLFAIVDGAVVHVLSRERGIGTIRLPFVGTDVAFSDGELVVSRAPARMVRREGKSELEEDRAVVLRFGQKGEDLGTVWRSGRLTGPTPGLTAMTNQFLVAVGAHRVLWIGRRAGTLELFRVRGADQTDVWKDPGTGEAASYPGSAPKGLKGEMGDFTDEARTHVSFWHAPVTIRDLVLHDGLAWVLLRAGALAEVPVVAIFEEGRATPLGYLVVQGDGVDFASLAVTDDGLWIIPRQGSEPVRYFERVPDPILLQMAGDWDRRHQSASGPN